MKIKTHSLIIVCWLTLLYTAVAFAAQEGTQAPGFNLTDMRGNAVTLDQYTGKAVLLVFWASWCVPCRDELPELDRLYQKYRDNGFVIIGISVDASADRVAAFMKKRPVGFPVVIDTQGAAADAYRFSGLPAGFLIGRDGIIKRTYRGSGKDLISRYDTDIIELLERK